MTGPDVRPVADTDRHGTWNAYVTDGCRCPGCTAAWSTYVAKCQLKRRRGEERLIDAAPTIAWVAAFARVWGIAPYRIIQDALGQHDHGHAQMLLHDNVLVDRTEAALIRNVTIDDISPTAWMPAGRARTMRDELRDRHGWTLPQLGRAVGVKPEGLRLRGARCAVGTYRALRDRLRAEALLDVCETCDAVPVGGGRWCRTCMDDRFGAGRTEYVGAVAQTRLGHDPRRHGTPSGARIHAARREPLCEACAAANRTYRDRLKADRQAAA